MVLLGLGFRGFGLMATSSLLWALLALTLCLSVGASSEELVITRAERRVDLTSHAVRGLVSLKILNSGSQPAAGFLFALSKQDVEKLAFITAAAVAKNKASATKLEIEQSSEAGYHRIIFDKPLESGQSTSVDVLYVLTEALTPFPEEIRQSDVQLVLYHGSAYLLSPYQVKHQTSHFKVPSSRVESYTKVDSTRFVEKEKEIKYGPYENTSPLSSAAITIHFENNYPFTVVKELEQEIEISHWGNVYVTENYYLQHEGARLKGSFSRLDYQARGNGITAFRRAIAVLPPRAHSIYYRDEIGNISTSHVRAEPQRTVVEFEPRFPLFGGWQVKFTLGYSVPLKDFVFTSPDGRRHLRFPFGSPITGIVVDKLVVKVVLPEGSRDPIVVSAPFPIHEHHEVKHTYLDTLGRTVVVLTKENIVPEQNHPLEVSYKFNPLFMVAEPLMLVAGFFCFFLLCMAYLHFDFPISKSSVSYQARLQHEEVLNFLQRLQKIMKRRLSEAEKLEAALRDLARTGDVSVCKASRKATDANFKESSREIKAVYDSLQGSARSSNVIPKVDSLISKEKEKMDKLLQKMNFTIDLYEKKLSNKEIDSRLAPHEQKYNQLKHEVAELLDALDD